VGAHREAYIFCEEARLQKNLTGLLHRERIPVSRCVGVVQLPLPGLSVGQWTTETSSGQESISDGIRHVVVSPKQGSHASITLVSPHSGFPLERLPLISASRSANGLYVPDATCLSGKLRAAPVYFVCSSS